MIAKDDARHLTVEQGQSVFDIALQEYGSVREVFRLLADNPALTSGLNTQLAAGQKLQIQRNPSGLLNADLVSVFRRNQVRINTGDDTEISNYLLQENYDLILQENESGILL